MKTTWNLSGDFYVHPSSQLNDKIKTREENNTAVRMFEKCWGVLVFNIFLRIPICRSWYVNILIYLKTVPARLPSTCTIHLSFLSALKWPLFPVLYSYTLGVSYLWLILWNLSLIHYLSLPELEFTFKYGWFLLQNKFVWDERCVLKLCLNSSQRN